MNNREKQEFYSMRAEEMTQMAIRQDEPKEKSFYYAFADEFEGLAAYYDELVFEENKNEK